MVPGRAFCKPCQSIKDEYNSRPIHIETTVRGQERKAAIEHPEIEVVYPLAYLLSQMKSADIISYLPRQSVNYLQDFRNIVGIDTENWNAQKGDTSPLNLFQITLIDFGSKQILTINRGKTQSLNIMWDVYINGVRQPLKAGQIEAKAMFVKFIGKKVLMFSTGNNNCDKYRIREWCEDNEWYRGLKWFNVGADVLKFNIGMVQAHWN